MTSDDEQNEENPIVTRHRKEKKELRAKLLAMKKAAKSGNKQKQKETNAECDKLEKEQEERHRNELAAEEPCDDSGETSGPPAASPEQVTSPEVGDDEEADDKDESSCGTFYKNFKISNKAAKRQAKKKEADEKMKTAAQTDKEAANKSSSEKHVEKDAIKKLLAEHRLKMVEIAADGDCLYNSLAHQLQEDGIEISSRKLRKHCAAYLREHKVDLMPFVSSNDVAEAAADPEVNWEKYILGVERCAEMGGVWGGELELSAIAEIYQKVIIVYKTDGERRLGEQFDNPEERPLRIVYLRRAFTLGEHYNSTCSF